MGGQSEHVTTELRAHHLTSDVLGPSTVTLWDTWGIAPDTFMGVELEALLSGPWFILCLTSSKCISCLFVDVGVGIEVDLGAAYIVFYVDICTGGA